MADIDPSDLSMDDWDEFHFPRPEEQEFDRVVDQAISRRGFLGGMLAFGSAATAMGTATLNASNAATPASNQFAFEQIAVQTDSTVHVPKGYSWNVLVRWGDPLFSDAPIFDKTAGLTTAGSDRVFGENTDGMELFNRDGRTLLVVNSEYVNPRINLPAAQEGKAQSADDVRRLQNFQGVTVMELEEVNAGWSVRIDSPYNRRITQLSPMLFDGPAAGHALLKTDADPSGRSSLGTFANCGCGRTPWGTYLTCEENFSAYFGTNTELNLGPEEARAFKRYSISTRIRTGYYNYHSFDARFDLSKNPNEPNRAGYVVEFDPWNPASVPVKHTALGRFKHENTAMHVASDGRIAIYMGDDERGEYVYRWISRDRYVPGEDTTTLLSQGQLYAAKFNPDMTGEWLALTPDSTEMTTAEIAVLTRLAAQRVGATTMDRPEWIAVNPNRAEAYCCLTNNADRGKRQDDGSLQTNAGGVPMTTNGPNPRSANLYGQIVRWRPHEGDHTNSRFDWDLYVMAGNPAVHKEGAKAGSANVNVGNLFNSPDGMRFDSQGFIWIQTDGNDDNTDEYAGMGNNQMLVGDPVTGEIRRFMTGPKGAEIAGLSWSADRRSMFVGIQHPGPSFPDGEDTLPRSSIVVIKRDDNAPIG